MSALDVSRSTPSDAAEVFELYRAVACRPGGLARLEHEVGLDYVRGFLEAAADRGLGLLARNDGVLVAEMHASTPSLYCFGHVLGDLTIAVHPGHQGLGVGARLFERFMQIVDRDMPHILRVELIARESNVAGIRLYGRLGFVVEGRLAGRIRNVDSTLEADLPMAWTRA